MPELRPPWPVEHAIYFDPPIPSSLSGTASPSPSTDGASAPGGEAESGVVRRRVDSGSRGWRNLPGRVRSQPMRLGAEVGLVLAALMSGAIPGAHGEDCVSLADLTKDPVGAFPAEWRVRKDA